MNCKPGDIARIVHPSMYGVLVEVLYESPQGGYVLPDGAQAFNQITGPAWVFMFLGAPQPAPVGQHGKTRLAKYAACADRWLRPLRDSDGTDETLSWSSLPADKGKTVEVA